MKKVKSTKNVLFKLKTVYNIDNSHTFVQSIPLTLIKKDNHKNIYSNFTNILNKIHHFKVKKYNIWI